MSEKFITLSNRISDAINGRRDAGQGTLEYVGAIVIAAIIVLAVTAAVRGIDVGGAVTAAANTILGR